MDQKEFGRRLVVIRKLLGWTQSEVGVKIGTNQLGISRIERGENVQSSSLLPLIEFYSKFVSVNALYSKSFPENAEELLLGNRTEVSKDLIKDLLSVITKQRNNISEVIKQIDAKAITKLEETAKML